MNKNLLITNLTGGPLVLFTYYKYLGGAIEKGITSDQLWANIKGKNRNFYYLSMLLSTVSYLYLFYFLVFKNQDKSQKALIGTIIFFIGASLWAPFLYNHFVNKINKTYTYLSLSLTSVGILILFLYLMKKEDIMSKIAISIFLFHILVLDNIIWSINFNKLKN